MSRELPPLEINMAAELPPSRTIDMTAELPPSPLVTIGPEFVFPPTPPPPEEDEKPPEEEPLRVLVLDTQSTCSKLFSQNAVRQLRLGQIHHPYVLAATLGQERIHTKIGNDKTRQLWDSRVERASGRTRRQTYETATNDLLRTADKLEKDGKTVFITEYPPFIMNHSIMSSALDSAETILPRSVNPTLIPSELLALFTPIIFIQHPALTLPTWMRLAGAEYGSYNLVDDQDFTLWTSLRWSRMLFDYLRHSQPLPTRVDSVHSNRSAKWEPGYVATKPYVVDAADVACNNNAMLAAVSRLLGLNYQEIKQGWTQYFSRAATSVRKAFPIAFANASSAFSERILGTPTVSINIDAEMAKWEVEFGKQTAQFLRRKVEEEMPHYRYLENFKVRVSPSLNMTALQQNISGVPGRRSSAAYEHTEEAGAPLRIIRSALDVDPNRRKSAIH